MRRVPMTEAGKDILIDLTVYIAIPLAGLIAYVALLQRIKGERIENPPLLSLLFLFAHYGGVLLVLLTSFFSQWSFMASINSVYLVVVAPLGMGSVAFVNYRHRRYSQYHVWVYRLALLYIAIVAVGVLVAIRLWGREYKL